ncbi:hypothetical protein G5B31_14945 [Rhodobacter sp. SGA-6-6]|uniref:hypothetical protein n=1 Tax=Rhodobacter sp. SGA-6-6 TaxID=2710882 RepID=UPI0013EA269A|nr:hypothetical protein [Rhodobacter sp. SGA-6-6]NGM46832.1 hypothetical protein [Rhodobacter sp. SGA-6-6]
MRAALVLTLCAGAAGAEGRPDPSFFTGIYERVGRDGTDPPGLLDDLLRIQPTVQGWGLLVTRCDGPGELSWPLELRPSSYDEVPNILVAGGGPPDLWCQYFTDHSNYPILTCEAASGARFTLWAVTDDRAADCGAGLP